MGKQPAERYKEAMRLYVLAYAVLVPFSAVAQVTVDQMTCAQAQRFVQQNGRIYAKSPAGPLPVYPISSIWTTPSCAGRQLIWPQTYATEMEFNAQWVTRALRLAAGRASGHGTPLPQLSTREPSAPEPVRAPRRSSNVSPATAVISLQPESRCSACDTLRSPNGE